MTVLQQKQPTAVPPFTVADLKKAIPKHCFERSLLKSTGYLVANLVVAASLFLLALFVLDNPRVPFWVNTLVLWPAYCFVQGCVCTGVWVIAHECGHGAFSPYNAVNNIVGLVLHSALMVPFFSWKYSHRRHHSNTGSLEKDEVFVPPTRKDGSISELEYLWLQSPGGVFIHIFLTLTVGWPLYLLFNMTGRPYPRAADHFRPTSPIFNNSERTQVAMSDVGLVVVALLLWKLGTIYGALTVAKFYVGPLLVVNAWLVIITLLQHTHLELPHYSAGEWDWLRGALATVDRDYGILNIVFHHIGDTHVAHHLFSTMPHYHALEATEAIKKVLGRYYVADNTPIAKALWKTMEDCHYVTADQDNGKIFWFADLYRVAKMKKS
eukprot:jgi/Mesvir1/10740/Mv13812-RA.1